MTPYIIEHQQPHNCRTLTSLLKNHNFRYTTNRWMHDGNLFSSEDQSMFIIEYPHDPNTYTFYPKEEPWNDLEDLQATYNNALQKNKIIPCYDCTAK